MSNMRNTTINNPFAGNNSDASDFSNPIEENEAPFSFCFCDDTDDCDVTDFLSNMAEGSHSPTLYRDNIIDQLMAVLISKDKPNALIVGPAGSGKTNIVEELATRIAKRGDAIPQKLRGYKIYSLNLADMVSGCSLVGELERKISSLLEYLRDPKHKAILFIDEVHMLFMGETYKKITQSLKPALGRGGFKVIAATTTQEVKVVDEDPAFNRRFTRVLVDELTCSQTTDILKKVIPVMEKHYGVQIVNDPQMPELIVKIADEFCSVGSHRPDNALTLLDRTIANILVSNSRKKKLQLTREAIEETAYRMTSGNSSKKKLDADKLHMNLSRIRGQEKTIEDILRVIKLHDMHVRPRTKPLTFLFAGPSGVGKSEIAKIIAKEYMGEKPIVLNMAEYNTSASINRIIGAPAGYIGSDSNSELPFDKLDTNPYQLILLDEFEKCDRAVQRLFMSAFDEGVMKTNHGKDIDFSKAIMIATTNAGCTSGCKSIGFGEQQNGGELTVSELSDYFDVELLNRFSHKYTFSSIDKATYASVIRDEYKRAVQELDCGRIDKSIYQAIEESFNEKVIDALVAKSYQVALGARPAHTAVMEYIDNLLLDATNFGDRNSAYNFAFATAS